MHHRPRDRESLHHSAREPEDELVRAIDELKALEKSLGARHPLRRRDTEVGAVEQENLPRRERKVEVRALGHDADAFLDRYPALPDLVLADPC